MEGRCVRKHNKKEKEKRKKKRIALVLMMSLAKRFTLVNLFAKLIINALACTIHVHNTYTQTYT